MKKWFWRSLAALVVLALAAGLTGFSYITRDFNYGPPADRSAWVDQAPSVNAGQLAYIQRDVAGATDIWLQVAQDEGERNEERAEAYRLLSRTSWRIYQNTDEGVAYARAAEEANPGEWENTVALSAAYRAAGHADLAMEAARRGIARADEPNARSEAANALARAALSGAAGKRLDQLTVEDRSFLVEARETLAPFVSTPPALLETSALAMAVATRLDDGPAMWSAWASYYHSPTGISAMVDQREAAQTLGETLPQWTPTSLRSADRQRIAEALAGSFFFEEAALLLTDQRDASALGDEQQITAIIAMNEFIKNIRQHTDEYYRAIAAANSSSNLFATLQTFQFRQGRERIERELWDALALTGDFDHRALVDILSDRFALYFNESPTSGVYDLHAGFRVLDTTHTATQYGRSADLRYVVVGRMISNGYESWLWDGRQQHGGWASDDTIHQVRPAYADDALSRWNRLTDPVQRAEEEDEIARLTAQDPQIIGDRRVVFLPGLAARLRWQGMNAVYDQARATGGEGGARLAFNLEMGEAVRSYSIFAHEGRHALDKQFAEEWVRDDSTELEFRAKISQVIFSDWPRLTLSSILNHNLGDGTPHGDANARLMEGVVIWMEDHRNEIIGLDVDAPLLPQFDQLTDDQIRAAFRSQDPWAAEDETSDAF